MQMIGPLDALKIVKVIRWALVGVALWVATWVTFLAIDGPMLGPRSAAGSAGDLASIESRARPILQEQQDVNYAAMFQDDPFGLATMDRPTQVIESSDINESMPQPSGMLLIGTVSGDPSVARAIFKDKDSNAVKVCSIGQWIGGARIEAIDRDKVTISVDGRTELIRLASRSLLARSSSDCADQGPGTGFGSHTTITSSVGRLLKDGKACIDRLPDGRYGLRIEGLEGTPDIKALGLEDGDIIHSINGQELTSPQKAFQVLRKARSAQRIDVELIRDGQTKRISLP